MSQPPRSAPTLNPSAVVIATAVAALILGFLVFRPSRPSGDVREWTPADHDQPAGTQGQPPSGRPKGAQPKGQDGNNLVEIAWAKSCTTCHGPLGRGDGPQGPMVKAPDLTRPDWQDRVSDEEIAQTIRKGRNGMPAFDLPPNVVQGLVQRIRASKAKK